MDRDIGFVFIEGDGVLVECRLMDIVTEVKYRW